MNNTHANKMIILVAPSGGGKSSMLERLLREDGRLLDVITYTTRPMRAGEQEGQHYHFVSTERFLELRDQGFFVEWAKVHSSLYGTPLDQIKKAWADGLAVIMDLDVQGATTCKSRFSQALTIFILPPSLEELRRRVLTRDKTPPADIELRMENAKKEMARAKEFDVRLVNHDFEAAYQELKKYIEDYLKSE